MNLWQLRKLSTNENLSEPQVLPENWESIFGLANIKDRLGDLSWLQNPELADKGWFETNIIAPDAVSGEETAAEKVSKIAKTLLAESDWTMLPDVPLVKGERIKWEEYRKALREINLQSEFPSNVTWPSKPE